MISNQEQQLYITNLLSETLPLSLKNEAHLVNLSLQEEGLFIVLQFSLSNGLKQIINSLPSDTLTLWKSDFHDLILSSFTTNTIAPITLLNLQPFSRMLLLSLNGSIPKEQLKKSLVECYQQLVKHIEVAYQSSMCGCFGSFETSFFDIGNSYKKARKLQEYSLIIGIKTCCFHDDFCFTQDYSLIEYQHIHDFDVLLNQKDWVSLEALLVQMNTTLTTHCANNAKTTYLYKEIYTLTIRYLFEQLGSYETLIKELNEGIIMFDHLFDDLTHVYRFYLDLLHRIADIDSTKPYSLHIKKALHIIHTEYMKDLSLSEISETLTLSNAYLSRLFKDEVGVNFKVYLTTYRIEVAKKLLLTSKKDLATIGLNVGYSSATQFIRVFKSFEGMTPKDYRHQLN